MLGGSFLPARFRSDHATTSYANPVFLNRRVTPILQSLSRRAFTHPIHTIVFVALLASTSYIGLLEGSLLDHTSLAGHATGGTDLASLAGNGRRLRLGEQTGWRWQIDNRDLDEVTVSNEHLALITLVFPDSLSKTFPRTAPQPGRIPISDNSSAAFLPTTPNPLSSISQDTSLALSVPYSEASKFLATIQELPNEALSGYQSPDVEPPRTSSWVMEAVRNSERSPKTFSGWAANAWTSFVDLVKVRASTAASE